MDPTNPNEDPGHAAIVAVATRVGLMSLGEAQVRAYQFLRDPRFFQCTMATAPFVPNVLTRLPVSVRSFFDEFEAVTLVGGDLVLARSIIKRSPQQPRLVQIGMVGVSTELVAHPFADTVYELDLAWPSANPERCASIWHYLVISAATADYVVSRQARSLANRRS
jgi:hypothetical protein